MALLFAVLALASVAGSQAYTTLPFATINGDTIRLLSTGSASECNALCVTEPTCNAAVHFGGAKKCWLKAQPLTAIESTSKGYLKVLVDDPTYSGFVESDFVQQPRSVDAGALSLKGTSVGVKPNTQACQEACWDAYNDKCIYSQLTIATKECIIAIECTGADCEDVRTYWKAGQRNFSRVYCKNAAYRRAWASWTGGYPKGSDPCQDAPDRM